MLISYVTVLFPQNGDTPLHRAAYNGKLDCVKVLMTCRETSLSLRNKVSIFLCSLDIFMSHLYMCCDSVCVCVCMSTNLCSNQ